MRRETAYKLAGRDHSRAHLPSAARLEKVREIRLYSLPPGQVEQAMACLQGIARLQLAPGSRPLSLVVRYSVLEHTLEGIEARLSGAGFHLDQSLYSKMVRSLVYFCEDVQRHNLSEPERLIKQSNEVYMQAYDQHLHGDRDETPLELRDFR